MNLKARLNSSLEFVRELQKNKSIFFHVVDDFENRCFDKTTTLIITFIIRLWRFWLFDAKDWHARDWHILWKFSKFPEFKNFWRSFVKIPNFRSKL